MRRYYTYYSNRLAEAPLPALTTTYARWSAAEAANGGLTAEGNWLSITGNKTLLKNTSVSGFTYSAAGLNGKPCLVSPAEASFYLPEVTFPADSAAAIIVMEPVMREVHVVYELSENVNNTQNSFANYIENNTSEAYVDVAGQKQLYACPQVLKPVVLASRFYANPINADFTQNKENSTLVFGGTGSSAGFGTKALYLFSRANMAYYPKGKLAAFHLFHTAPDTLTWQAWVAYYYNLYAIN